MEKVDVIVIGGGPAGLAAALAADETGAHVLLLEREARLGGILKQCIHDGFGIIHFGEKLSGPEYAERFVEAAERRGLDCLTQTFVTDIRKDAEDFIVTLVNREGIRDVSACALVLATGCRERTSKQVFIHGTRPSGVFTAGTAQHFVNLLGEKITRRCVILGSGDIGLIMARRLTLEGAKVLGVYEAKAEPSGLTRNLAQCLEDYEIPLHLAHTVTRVFGASRLEGVEIAAVDAAMKLIPGTEKRVDCDALILSVGLIPENEMAERLGVDMDAATKGPRCDNHFMTSVPGVFSCGNALHVNDLVDYVSESGALAGKFAASYAQGHRDLGVSVPLIPDEHFLYLVPQSLALGTSLSPPSAHTGSASGNQEGRSSAERTEEETTFYFRSRQTMENVRLSLCVDGKPVYGKHYVKLRPPEMERLSLSCGALGINPKSRVEFTLRKAATKSERRDILEG